MNVYRICKKKYPKNDGEGARLAGGRWNHKGTAVIYCGATASLCALEVLANGADLAAGMVVIEAKIPRKLAVATIDESDLPSNWNTPVASRKTRDLGSQWVKSGVSAVLSVPSVIVPSERNYLLNPAHSDFAKIQFSKPKDFVFDRRLKQSSREKKTTSD